jgi:hypothetical protein
MCEPVMVDIREVNPHPNLQFVSHLESFRENPDRRRSKPILFSWAYDQRFRLEGLLIAQAFVLW